MITLTRSTDIVPFDAPLPADRQPATVFLSGLAAGGEPAMSQALNKVA